MPIVQIKHGRKTVLEYQADTRSEATLVLAQQLAGFSLSFGVRVMHKWLAKTYDSQSYTTDFSENDGDTEFSVHYIP